MNMHQVFRDLADFYMHLSSRLLKPESSNPCKSCVECCKYLFYLSRYEFEYLASAASLKDRSISLVFVPLLPGQDDPRFAHNDHCCPLLTEDGCLAYEFRPLPCRLMGPYVPYNSDLISGCVYTHPVIYRNVEEIPLWDEYTAVLRRHPSPPGFFIHAA
ncbi:MAG: YkgJ family cysteine cluster protein [Candidatus Xenobiia bacterium LiM19]